MQVASVPRTLVIAAHPDDETIGAGVLVSRVKGVQVVHATEGSPANLSDALAAGFASREEYAAARKVETTRALALAGLSESAIRNLHFTDQQLCSHLDDMSTRIVDLLEQFRPSIVLTHAYEGGHPDHDSVALACHLARELHARTTAECSFDLVEFTCYHAGSNGLRAYEFLPSDDAAAQSYRLTATERDLKVGMLRQFTTQAKTLAPFMSPEFERFRLAPRYDFRRAPHEGKLFYENFDWGVDGTTWRELASRTLKRLLH